MDFRPSHLLLLALCAATTQVPTSNAKMDDSIVTVVPEEYPHALRNPLKGFRPRQRDGGHEYGTLCRVYLKWNELERDASDRIERIMEVCNRKWRGVEEHNIKVIPRVYLHWKGDKKYWPADMKTDDYSSEQFQKRARRLVMRLGECWDKDPRVAWVQMGIIGKWGEQHSPSPDLRMQNILGKTFSAAFKNKKVTVRHPWEFEGFNFGIYWDSWAHIEEMPIHGQGIAQLGDRWKTRPIGGECAYDWGRWEEQPGEDPNDTLRDYNHRHFLTDSIRSLHCNNLGWVAEYSSHDLEVKSGAEEVQKAFGYRFVIDEVRYPAVLTANKPFAVSFKVRNTGSGPFYYNWPVEVSLLEPTGHRVVWKETFKKTDIRDWLPGDVWNSAAQKYEQNPRSYNVKDKFKVPSTLPKGEYVLALAILDPAGKVPSCRFAVRNYYTGGRHPIGRIGMEKVPSDSTIEVDAFDDPALDTTLHYAISSSQSDNENE